MTTASVQLTTDPLSVRGGIGGTVARTEDLERAALAIESAAGCLEQVRGSVARSRRVIDHARASTHGGMADGPIAAHIDATESALEWVVQGTGGARAAALEVLDISTRLREVIAGYERAEAQAQAIVETGFSLWGAVRDIGSATWWLLRSAFEGGARFTWLTWTAPLNAVGIIPDPARDGIDQALASLGPDSPPSLTNLMGRDGVQGLLGFLDWIPLTGGGIWAVSACPPLTLATVQCVPSQHNRRTSVYDLTVSSLGAAGHGLSYLLAGPQEVTATVTGIVTDVRPATGIADYLERTYAVALEGGGPPSSVAIERLTSPEGENAWVVTIPGTQDWFGFGNGNVHRGNTNMEALANGESFVTDAVARAVEQVGIVQGEPLMLVGHSQGGIAACALATDPVFATKYHVVAVATAGAPCANFAIPSTVSTAHLENLEDPVSGLDGHANPDTPTRTTVSRDLSASVDPQIRAISGSIADAHGLPAYIDTARLADASNAPSLVAFRDQTAQFYAQDATVTRYVVQATVISDPTAPHWIDGITGQALENGMARGAPAGR